MLRAFFVVFALACVGADPKESTGPVDPMELATPLGMVNSIDPVHPIDPTLLHDTYTDTFRLRDGSTLASVDAAALAAMRGSVQRLLAVGVDDNILNHTRALPDDRLLGLLLLAVAGNFTVGQSTALPQRCGIVVDPGSGALVLRDNAAAQSVILEVLLIVSIVCLVRAWGGVK